MYRELVVRMCHALEAVGITEFDDPASLKAALRARLRPVDA
jgi:hypothetical protein